ncbi:hypothetical protein NA57DRAFT_78381 [Rhizodiscina lignyota]|uniref:Uncharacterized protein n=1 Tax=Rhizodiscina lignyota TaxID=1504668 RepID=A0A9P4ICD8_9PEZI|nr:hypothetical protein NA57DRAFT_78381 [Rhizodiscina lignyota]
MSDKLMDTRPGGENTQYESTATFTKPHNKEGGQLSDPTTSTSTPKGVDPERAEKTAQNIRYGQAMSEQGMGGQTTTSGEGNVDSGFGGAASQSEDLSTSDARTAQGYGGQSDMRRDVGA